MGGVRYAARLPNGIRGAVAAVCVRSVTNRRGDAGSSCNCQHFPSQQSCTAAKRFAGRERERHNGKRITNRPRTGGETGELATVTTLSHVHKKYGRSVCAQTRVGCVTNKAGDVGSSCNLCIFVEGVVSASLFARLLSDAAQLDMAPLMPTMTLRICSACLCPPTLPLLPRHQSDRLLVLV